MGKKYAPNQRHRFELARAITTHWYAHHAMQKDAKPPSCAKINEILKTLQNAGPEKSSSFACVFRFGKGTLARHVLIRDDVEECFELRALTRDDARGVYSKDIVRKFLPYVYRPKGGQFEEVVRHQSKEEFKEACLKIMKDPLYKDYKPKLTAAD